MEIRHSAVLALDGHVAVDLFGSRRKDWQLQLGHGNLQSCSPPPPAQLPSRLIPLSGFLRKFQLRSGCLTLEAECPRGGGIRGRNSVRVCSQIAVFLLLAS